MRPLNITLDKGEGITLVSNVFIDQYMKDANDAQLKIYLYLLRMVGANLPTDISEIADIFNHTEKDVIKSLKYWERTGIMLLSYDEKGNIAGVSLKNPDGFAGGRSEEHSDDSETLKNTEFIENSDNVNRDVTDEVTDMEISEEKFQLNNEDKMDYKAELDSYSLDDIKKLRSNPEVTMLINVAAQYFGRMFNPTEIKSLLFIYDKLDFSMELTDYILEYCADRNHKSMSYVMQTAINWYEMGIKSVEEAKTQSKNPDKTTGLIMKALGKKGEPAAIEMEYIRRWVREYDFSTEVIIEACQRTVLRTDSNRFAYADSILQAWRKQFVHTLADVANLDRKFEDNKKSNMVSSNSNNDSVKKTSKTSRKKEEFCQIEKRDYDFDELERLALYSNVTSRK